MKNSVQKYDVLIAGTGVAGLCCALNLPRDMRVLMLTKAAADESDSFLAQGGICVLHDPDDETTLIREITAESYAALKAGGIVSKGMIPKIENALKAVEKGVRSVTIRSSENLSNGIGTVIRNS